MIPRLVLLAFLVALLQGLAHFDGRLVHELVGDLVGQALERLSRIGVVGQLRQCLFHGLLLDQLRAVAQLPNLVGRLVGAQPLLEQGDFQVNDLECGLGGDYLDQFIR